MKNLVICHGGAPTSVINASLVGAIKELKKEKFDGLILAARYGSKGLLNSDFIDLTNIDEKTIKNLIATPGSAIGSSREPLYEKEYNLIIDNLIKKNIGYVLFTGGNGSMDTIGNISHYAKKRNIDIKCIGIPKTIDNDIAISDHAPGFISTANYIIKTVKDCEEDVKGLPIHASIIEVMGRNAGWLAASSILAKNKENDAPHMILCPEIPFDEEKFLLKVKELMERNKGIIIVASEGLKDKDNNPIVKPIFKSDRATYYGDVGTYLATLIISKLGIKARSEKPGIISRCSSELASSIDIKEALLVGKIAAKSVLKGKTGYMVGIKRISSTPYKIKPILIKIEDVMLTEAKMPLEYIDEENFTITKKFIDWAKPMFDLNDNFVSFLDK